MLKKVYIKCIACAVLILVLVYYLFHPLTYKTDYFYALGIGVSHLYSDLIERKGEPLDVVKNENGDWIVYYDGLGINFGKYYKKSSFQVVRVTGNQYKFGFWQIGIGTSRKKIESVYKHIDKIKDLPKEEFGIIDNGTWVYFKFDKNNNVSEIVITDCGP